MCLGEGDSSVLCVGHVCVDMINVCSQYPEEDSKVGTTTKNNRFLLEDFAKYGINTDHVVLHKDCECPSSCVILSTDTASRTIIHSNKNLPELTVEDFAQVDLKLYRWVHFEGRNVPNVIKMMQLIREYNKGLQQGNIITISVEIEKAKPELEALIPLPDVIFVSKDYAAFKGYSCMKETVEKVQALATPGSIVICPWGEEGASAKEDGGMLVRSPAFPPPKIVDTLGAGDTFNAATIFALSLGHDLEDSIRFGCRSAGGKVGVMGWEPLRDVFKVCGLLPFAQNTVARPGPVSAT